jgi:hypothetical protein
VREAGIFFEPEIECSRARYKDDLMSELVREDVVMGIGATARFVGVGDPLEKKMVV